MHPARCFQAAAEIASWRGARPFDGRPSASRSGPRAASLAVSGAAWSLSVLWRHLQLSGSSRVPDLRRQALAQDTRQAKPKRPRYLGVLHQTPDRLPAPRTGYPSGLPQMIAPPPVLPEEPAEVTPHGGFRGGKSQQWLRYPIEPHVRFGGRGGVQPLPDPYRQKEAPNQFLHIHPPTGGRPRAAIPPLASLG